MQKKVWITADIATKLNGETAVSKGQFMVERWIFIFQSVMGIGGNRADKEHSTIYY